MDFRPIGINSLPVEILCDIFLKWDRDARRRYDCQVPLTISRVCRYWRDVSLSLRVLWTYIDICISGRARERYIEFFETWLRRSNGAPLKLVVKFDLTYNRSLEDNRVAERVVCILISHQWHWEKVQFNWKFSASPGFPGIILTQTPMLTKLKLHVELINGWVSGSFNLAQASKLEYVELRFPLSLEFADKSMITTLHSLYSYLDPQQCRKLLEAAPNLKEVFINSRFGPTDEVERFVISHSLERIDLTGPASHIIMDKLVLPALMELLYKDFASRNGGDLTGFIRRSLPPLTRLTVSCVGAATLTSILPLLPLLRTLVMRESTISAELFELLTVPSGASTNYHARYRNNRIICPDLLCFEFFWDYSVEGNFRECIDALCTMLESRWDDLIICDHPTDILGPHSPLSSADRRKLWTRIADGQPFCASAPIPRRHRVLGIT
ncbi:uncharacterized protein FOMMEDRAFT_156776 [Fomitiporia mediterranea MF3/22]|uniref:uncharacterized protein n=1 Tax=Fomitiporia mediterranea (strain MF3/22) TaxID=694068 RepID=UPI00044077D6|nr:uncharacterized protein FOMMEDRAFT_156776 [Fomitiporia mediterranea MF3/22]EJD03371.1 hypothetical protein FOMMEDRAFT_156776 [Fomitiporia mediterranea MF3/22]